MATKTVEKVDRKALCDGAVVGVFDSKDAADACYDALLGRGYTTSNINVMMSDKTRTRYYPGEFTEGNKAGSKAVEGMGVGGAIGTAVGASLAAVAAIGTSIAFPPSAPLIGGLIVSGPLAAAFAGAGAGAASGGLIGSLIGAGLTEQNAQRYNEALVAGGVVLSVQTDTSKEAKEVQDLMVEFGGTEVATC